MLTLKGNSEQKMKRKIFFTIIFPNQSIVYNCNKVQYYRNNLEWLTLSISKEMMIMKVRTE